MALYDQFELEQERLDGRVALICSVIANAWRDPKKRAYKPADFMPRKGGKNKSMKEQNPDELLAMIRSLNASLGGKEEIIDGK